MNFKVLCLVGMFAVFGVNANPTGITVPEINHNHSGIHLGEQPQQNVVFNDIAPIEPPVANNNQVGNNQFDVNPMWFPDLIEVPQQNVVFNDIAPIIPPIANNNEVDLHLEQQQQEQMVIQGNNVEHQIDQQLLEIAPISIPTANTNPHLT